MTNTPSPDAMKIADGLSKLPWVSRRDAIALAIDAARRNENEACAKVVDDCARVSRALASLGGGLRTAFIAKAEAHEVDAAAIRSRLSQHRQ